jgi:hypothetical protein
MLELLLLEKLRSYIIANNPDLMLQLQQQMGFTHYLEDKIAAVAGTMEQLVSEGKPQYIIQELCLKEMTAELRPSRFNYLREVLETEFTETFERFRELGVLTYELTNMIEYCKGLFELFEFSEEREDDRNLRYAIVGALSEYLSRDTN